MATVTQPVPAIETSSPVQEESPGSLLDFRHRITVEEYHRMAEAGVFGPEPRLELLEGVLDRQDDKESTPRSWRQTCWANYCIICCRVDRDTAFRWATRSRSRIGTVNPNRTP